MVGHNLRAYIEDLEKKMRKAASDLEFEEAGRLRDEIRSWNTRNSACRPSEHKAPVMGRSNEGKPGTRKTRYGKSQKMRMGGGRRGRDGAPSVPGLERGLRRGRDRVRDRGRRVL